MLLYNVKGSSSQKSLQFSRFERRFARIWGNPIVPIGIFFGHLYLIALFLRNPFQKVDLDWKTNNMKATPYATYVYFLILHVFFINSDTGVLGFWGFGVLGI